MTAWSTRLPVPVNPCPPVPAHPCPPMRPARALPCLHARAYPPVPAGPYLPGLPGLPACPFPSTLAHPCPSVPVRACPPMPAHAPLLVPSRVYPPVPTHPCPPARVCPVCPVCLSAGLTDRHNPRRYFALEDVTKRDGYGETGRPLDETQIGTRGTSRASVAVKSTTVTLRRPTDGGLRMRPEHNRLTAVEYV